MKLFQNWFGKPTLTKELQSELQKLNYILENSLKEENIIDNSETRKKQINEIFKHKTGAEQKELKIEKIIQKTLTDYKSGKRSCSNPAKIINLAQMERDFKTDDLWQHLKKAFWLEKKLLNQK